MSNVDIISGGILKHLAVAVASLLPKQVIFFGCPQRSRGATHKILEIPNPEPLPALLEGSEDSTLLPGTLHSQWGLPQGTQRDPNQRWVPGSSVIWEEQKKWLTKNSKTQGLPWRCTSRAYSGTKSLLVLATELGLGICFSTFHRRSGVSFTHIPV